MSEYRQGGEVLADLGSGLTLERLPIRGLKEQSVNANVMPPAMFTRLVENIRKRGDLESVPFCAEVEGKVEIVSGHHRIRAARTAGLKEVTVLVDRSGLSRSTIIAKQLAHNAIAGRDDEDILLQLISRIETPDDLLETGLDLDALNRSQGVDVGLFAANADFNWQTITFAFLPHQFEEFDQLIKTLNGRQDLIGVADEAQFRPFLEAAAKYAKVRDVRSVGTVIALLTRVALEIAEDEKNSQPNVTPMSPPGKGQPLH
jgi:hypothetical protein